MSKSMQRCIDALLVAGKLDWVPMPEVAWIAKDVGGAKADDDIRRLSLDLIRELVTSGLMEIGDLPTAKGARQLSIWTGTREEWLGRLEREWLALGRNPELGDLGWLQNTLNGDEIANRLLVERDEQKTKGRL
jgi:hypothetical protein